MIVETLVWLFAGSNLPQHHAKGEHIHLPADAKPQQLGLKMMHEQREPRPNVAMQWQTARQHKPECLLIKHLRHCTAS